MFCLLQSPEPKDNIEAKLEEAKEEFAESGKRLPGLKPAWGPVAKGPHVVTFLGSIL